MKALPILTLCGTLVAGAAFAGTDVVEKTTTSETTYRGTVSQVDPDADTIIMKSESGAPTRYIYTEKTTYVDAAGNTVTRESIVNHPVTVYYTRDGDRMTVSKVVVSRPEDSTVRRERETTTVEKR